MSAALTRLHSGYPRAASTGHEHIATPGFIAVMLLDAALS